MKDYSAGRIFCKCSTRMHCNGKPVQIGWKRAEGKKEGLAVRGVTQGKVK